MSAALQPAAGTEILEVKSLSMRFGGLLAVDGVDFQVQRGSITALIGPNGAGKTTVFNCITGFYRPTAGQIRLRRADGSVAALQTLKDHRIARAGVARTFQNIRLFAGMTVLENLLIAQHIKLQKATGFGIGAMLGLSGYRAAEAEAIDRAAEWLRAIGLLDRADDIAGGLPYGAQRRLEIARAMCTMPALLCLDEPAAGLNPRESDDLAKLLVSIRDGTATASPPTSVLLIEHDMGIVMRISDHVVVLDHGRKIAEGPPDQVRNDRHVIAAYLGEDEEG
ncbi:ABC transporter ATP-binding protein [Falsiroseomonas tokyonensis]|uniref:ABC transporter ATP-binding protein n=1 Tax=Falsiroseomonas tokyonensis TaxID=430521 RepID=A0ABV7BSZ5_9PROT|nr:ATP-binding cassette domain-containing protein [Falsiroseomonas tokyonensis]MBU8538301.1 ATP-binding cassette domain-containing protein [Falsiroseomonas tokyonensis]